MRIARTLAALAGLAFAGLLVAPAAVAAAEPLTPGQIQICTTEATPPGYYVASVSQEALPGCPNTYGLMNTPGWSKVVAPIPNPPVPFVGCLATDGFAAKPGYAVTAIDNGSPACGFYGYLLPLSPGHTITSTPLTGGAMDVCVLGGIPAGYVPVQGSARPSGGMCGHYMVPASNDLITIVPQV